jgi:hypothetical protein
MNMPPAPAPVIEPSAPPLFERWLWNHSWFMALLCLVFVGLDWELVPLAVFPFVFVFPLMLVAWNRGLWFALACAVLFSASRAVHALLFDARAETVDDIAAVLVCFFVLALLALLTSLMARQSRLLRHRVQQLEGILPICAGCKSIRDESGNWMQLEGYITTHTPAQFSHSFCPACYKAFYGELPPAAGAK